ncbi:Nuclear pore complex nucleoporin component [Quaeritorhiza haematococci]|nr:Nuclear pore complex nucleoporin component [Quaeritorhiza haematococci]
MRIGLLEEDEGPSIGIRKSPGKESHFPGTPKIVSKHSTKSVSPPSLSPSILTSVRANIPGSIPTANADSIEESISKNEFARAVRLAKIKDTAKVEAAILQDEAWRKMTLKASELEMFSFLARQENVSPEDVGVPSRVETASPALSHLFSPPAHSRFREQRQRVAEFQSRTLQMKKSVQACIRQSRAEEQAATEALRIKKEEEERRRNEEEARKKAEAEAARRKAEEEANQERIRKEEQAKKAAREEAEAKAEAKALKEAQDAGCDPGYCSVEAWKEAKQYLEKIAKIKTEGKAALGSNMQLMKALFERKMIVTARVGQLRHSVSKIIETATALDQVFNEGKQLSQIGYEWLMDYTAKMFVGESDDDWRKKARYKKKDDDNFETEIQYNERMCGILAFYAAIVQLEDGNNVHGMKYAWIWFARILNLTPRRITAQLIYTFLEIAGHAFVQTYQTQARKLLMFIFEQYIPKMHQKSTSTATRLKLFLEEKFVRNHYAGLPPHKGQNLDP